MTGPGRLRHLPHQSCPAATALPATNPHTDARAFAAAGALLRALSAPVRVAIVTLLADGPRCVHELVEELDVAQPLVSQHLRVLRAAGVVTGERRGREVAYHLRDDRVGHLVADAVAHVETWARGASRPGRDGHHDGGGERGSQPPVHGDGRLDG